MEDKKSKNRQSDDSVIAICDFGRPNLILEVRPLSEIFTVEEMEEIVRGED